MGYENNNDKSDFLNLMSNELVTIDEKNSFPDFNIFICFEYPCYAIYKCCIRNHFNFHELVPFPQIAFFLRLKEHEVRFILRNVLIKIEPNFISYYDLIYEK